MAREVMKMALDDTKTDREVFKAFSGYLGKNTDSIRLIALVKFLGQFRPRLTDEILMALIDGCKEPCVTGMTCEDFSFLTVAGPYREDLPENVRERMDAHELACEYHRSSA